MTSYINNSLTVEEVAKQAFEQHAIYKELALRHRRFKHRDIVPLLKQLEQHPLFEVQVAGKSVEQRDIYLVKAGTGDMKVMLWSQMHGDEPTATMALFDLLNFLRQSYNLDPVRQHILQQTTLYILPMLNPDGAEKFKRRNALEIDLNRDALRLQSPEAQLLKKLRDTLQPEFGFNLHDQSRLYTVGTTPKPATISFLAPAFDHAQTVDAVRERAMRTIAGMNQALQQLVPGHVAKFSDEHEPRAFGDNIQKWGTSVILIESGGYKGDPERQFVRQLNFASMVSALHLIGRQGYHAYEVAAYYRIPENKICLYDLVVRHVRYPGISPNTYIDLGIIREEVEAPHAPDGFYHQSSVQEIGDMSVFHGYEELNGEGLTLVPGRIYGQPFKDIASLTPACALELLTEGYTTIRVEMLPAANLNPQEFPLNILSLNGPIFHELSMGGNANFVLKQADGQVRYAIVNGFIYDLDMERPDLFHGLAL